VRIANDRDGYSVAMTDDAVLTTTFLVIAAGILVWAIAGMVVRLVRHRRAKSANADH
jgi:hypothetical protein